MKTLLAYADWLDEHAAPGDAAKADFIRVSIREALLSKNYAALSHEDLNTLKSLQNRQTELWHAHRKTWAADAPIPLVPDGKLAFRRPGSSLRIQMERGLPSELMSLSVTPLRDEKLALLPVGTFNLHVKNQSLTTLESYSITARIRKICLHGERLPDAQVFREFFHSPKIAKLQSLDLTGLPNLTDAHWSELQKAQPLANLQELLVAWNGRGTISTLLQKISTGPWKKLKTLRVKLPLNLELSPPPASNLKAPIHGLPWELSVLEFPVGYMTEDEVTSLFRLSKFQNSLQTLQCTHWFVQNKSELPEEIGRLKKLRQLLVEGRGLTDDTVGRILRHAPLTLEGAVFEQPPRIQGQPYPYAKEAGPFTQIPEKLLQRLNRLELNLPLQVSSFEGLFLKDKEPRVFPSLHLLSLKQDTTLLPILSLLLRANAFPALASLYAGVDNSAAVQEYEDGRAFIAAATPRLARVELHGRLDSPRLIVNKLPEPTDPLKSVLYYDDGVKLDLLDPRIQCAEALELFPLS